MKHCSKPYRCKKRRGFTLVELLVVIAIIGVLVGLLLPAVQAAREAARRIQCTNSIRNLALATLNYESTNGKFPPAYLAMEDPSTGQLERFGGTNINASYRPNWVIMVLPYLEEQALYDQFVLDDFNVQISHDLNLEARGTQLAVMRCASDPYGDTPCSIAGGNWARGNYGINMIQSGDLWGYKAWDDNDGPRGSSYGPRRGIAYINKSQSIAQVSDGTTHTILIAELRTGLSEVDPRGSWAMGQCAASAHAHHAVSYGNTVNYCDPGATDVLVNSQEVIDSVGAETLRQECMYPWSGGTWSYRSVVRSVHPGGAMIAMADGSARMISDFVDKGNYSAALRDDYTAVYRDASKFRVWERLNVSNDGYPIDGEL